MLHSLNAEWLYGPLSVELIKVFGNPWVLTAFLVPLGGTAQDMMALLRVQTAYLVPFDGTAQEMTALLQVQTALLVPFDGTAQEMTALRQV